MIRIYIILLVISILFQNPVYAQTKAKDKLKIELKLIDLEYRIKKLESATEYRDKIINDLNSRLKKLESKDEVPLIKPPKCTVYGCY